MAKIAAELECALAAREANGSLGKALPRTLAQGRGWKVSDIVCTSGPRDRAFEEQHTSTSIAIVAAGSFQYQCGAGRELMTPGSLLLGNAGQYFECGHDHASGDRCIAFTYDSDFFEELASDAGARCSTPVFRVPRIPALRELSPHIAKACSYLMHDGVGFEAWQELAILLAVQSIRLANGAGTEANEAMPGALARVTRVVRLIDKNLDAKLDLTFLAQQARLSPYHFLRTFESVTGLTPHQYILRARLREAAMRLIAERDRVLDVALACGFGDVSNFNRAFRMEFDESPRAYRGG